MMAKWMCLDCEVFDSTCECDPVGELIDVTHVYRAGQMDVWGKIKHLADEIRRGDTWNIEREFSKVLDGLLEESDET
jgi:hypothetical protein